MPEPAETKECIQCGPRLLSQFRKSRDGVSRRPRCRRCTKLNTRRARWLEREAAKAAEA
jgi:hypothetical protein